MSWEWSPYMRRVVRQRTLEELVGGRLLLKPARGEPLAEAMLTGEQDTVVVRAVADGEVATAVIENARGDVLASAPGSEACDRVDVQQGAEITVTFALGA